MPGSPKQSPFDWVRAIGEEKRNLYAEGRVDYNPFLVNRAFSQHVDTILYAQDMNSTPWLDRDAQHTYLQALVRPKRRRSSWPKATPPDPAVEVAAEVFECSLERARKILRALSTEDVASLRAIAEARESPASWSKKRK